jgi:cyclase
LIVCLDVDHGGVVKGTQFQNLREHGLPEVMAADYESQGADEIMFLDITASAEARVTHLDDVRRTASPLSIPLTVGGGVRNLDDMNATLRAGADKVTINTAAIERPLLIADAAAKFGRQCVVVSIDALCNSNGWSVVTHGGRRSTSLDAVEWAQRAVALGAGELLVTSIDRDGTRRGYDNALTRAISDRVSVPVIASGGAGEPLHLADAFDHGGADAVLVAGIVHRRQYSIAELKAFLARAGFPMRQATQEQIADA